MQKQKKVSRVWLDRRLTATEPTKNENNAMEIASAFAILFFRSDITALRLVSANAIYLQFWTINSLIAIGAVLKSTVGEAGMLLGPSHFSEIKNEFSTRPSKMF